MPTRILVIEDNPANMELMTYLLKAHGYTLLTATDGESGLAVATREKPDLIICDVHLPQLDGYGVVRVLKRTPSLRDIPAVAVTALAMVGDREKLISVGFDGYISKPIEPETFVAEIERYLPANNSRPTEAATVLLVICDNPSHRALLAPHLDSWKTVWAGTVDEGRDLAHVHSFDLAIVDLGMPMKNCCRAIAAAKAAPTFARLPLLIFGDRPSAMDNAGLDSGIARFLQRTVESGVLADEIETCLHQVNRRKDGDHIDR